MIKTVTLKRKDGNLFANGHLVSLQIWVEDEVKYIVGDSAFEGSSVFNLFSRENKNTAEKIFGRNLDKIYYR